MRGAWRSLQRPSGTIAKRMPEEGVDLVFVAAVLMFVQCKVSMCRGKKADVIDEQSGTLGVRGGARGPSERMVSVATRPQKVPVRKIPSYRIDLLTRGQIFSKNGHVSMRSHGSKPPRPSPAQLLGELVRARRRALRLNQAELCDLAGVGLAFLYELEHGKDTVRLDKVLAVLAVLGLELHVREGKLLLSAAPDLRAPQSDEPGA